MKTIIVSLPRTGTKSLCQMGIICGLRAKHVSFKFKEDLPLYDLFGDTPFFCISALKQIVATDRNVRLIYATRDWVGLYRSWRHSGLFDYYIRLCKSVAFTNAKADHRYDKKCYFEAFDGEILSDTNYAKLFSRHEQRILDFALTSGLPLLRYNFKDGWSSFCHWIERPVPDCPVPVLNSGNMAGVVG